MAFKNKTLKKVIKRAHKQNNQKKRSLGKSKYSKKTRKQSKRKLKKKIIGGVSGFVPIGTTSSLVQISGQGAPMPESYAKVIELLNNNQKKKKRIENICKNSTNCDKLYTFLKKNLTVGSNFEEAITGFEATLPPRGQGTVYSPKKITNQTTAHRGGK